MQKKKYNIALDIGTASVGWSVTDENNNLLKKGGKNMWGVRTFKAGKEASTRRGFRAARRRLSRRRERIRLLQNLLIDDIEKTDENFIPRLRETSLVEEDKTIAHYVDGKKYNLFSDAITDKTYYKEYPTIYHLRNALVENEEKFDIRLVYLAIHHIIKYRGNFLYEGDFKVSDTEIIKENLVELISFLEENQVVYMESDLDAIINIFLNNKLNKNSKKESLLKLFQFDANNKKNLENILKGICGLQFDLKEVFDLEIEKTNINFSKENKEEELLIQIIENNGYLEIYEIFKSIYSWQTLQEILKGENSISKAFINKYNKYKKELRLLKDIYKKYLPDKYKDMFHDKDSDNNYFKYNKPLNNKGEYETFIRRIEKEIKNIETEFTEKEEVLKLIKNKNFLIKLRTAENFSIPNQLHREELEKILNNQSKYYNNIKENKDKILMLLTFRIPYYVGPLALQIDDLNNGSKTHVSEWAWIQRKSNDKILPWNFEEIVDVNKTAEEFIQRMLSTCTYLINEKVMPKNSLLCSEFNLLQELNNIRLNDKKLSKDQKHLLVEDLFKKKKNVTKKNVEEFFENQGIINSNIEGLSDLNKFNSSLASYIDMKNIFGDVNEDNYKIIEEIIYWITIFEDKKILKRKINEKYPEISEDKIKLILKLRYAGWSRLSKKLIDGIKGVEGQDQRTIIEILREEKENFMQIINNKKYPFKEILEQELTIKDTVTYEDIEELRTSPANKKAIWQSIKVVKEIISVTKTHPENLYIEFARNEGKKGKRTDKRKDQLKKTYEQIKKDISSLMYYDSKVYEELKKVDKIDEKAYLYFLQNGKCVYSKEELNFDTLNLYHIDHINPRSFTVDNSFDNKVLVKDIENARKSNRLYLDIDIINSYQNWWKSLLKNGLMTQKKYYNLIKGKTQTDATEEQFLKRQLVETRQIILHVTKLFKSISPETKIFPIRSALINDFRNKYNIYKNRDINDCHHAHDAYIASIIGNTINKEWKIKEEFVYNDYIKNYIRKKIKQSPNLTEKEKNGIIMSLVGEHIKDEGIIKKRFQYKDYFFSEKLEEDKGEFYYQNLFSPRNVKGYKGVPVKIGKSTNKYGGYSGVQYAYGVLFSYINKKNIKEYELIGIPIQTKYLLDKGLTKLDKYVETYLFNKNIEFKDVKVIMKKIFKNQMFINKNKNLMKFTSPGEMKSAKPLFVSEEILKLLDKINRPNKYKDPITDEEYLQIFDYLLDKMRKEYIEFQTSYNKIEEARDRFINLDKNKKTNILLKGFIALPNKGYGNFEELKLSDYLGRKQFKTVKTNFLDGIKFVSKSVTGIYERRFTIYELENRCSK